jgi:hypothetical protein
MAARRIVAVLLAVAVAGPASAVEPPGAGGAHGEHQTCPHGQTSQRVCTRWVKVSAGHRSRCGRFAERCGHAH